MRIQVVFTEEEGDQLANWSRAECRDPHQQVRFLVRRELERQGLLPKGQREAVAAGTRVQDAHR